MIFKDQDLLAWKKMDGLLPAVIQDADTLQVLMLGYFNAESLEQTKRTGLVTFYSRSKPRLWVKGESSGHTLSVVKIEADCDRDTLLVLARPAGPTCHRGTPSRWCTRRSLPGDPRQRGRSGRTHPSAGRRAVRPPAASPTQPRTGARIPRTASLR